jgi:hypothetical protein
MPEDASFGTCRAAELRRCLVEEDVERGDAAIANDDHVTADIFGRFAPRTGAPGKAFRIVEHLWRSTMRILRWRRRLWFDLHKEVAGRSSRGEARLVAGSGHNIARDQPGAVIQTVDDVTDIARRESAKR